jgi:hypothetical protein
LHPARRPLHEAALSRLTEEFLFRINAQLQNRQKNPLRHQAPTSKPAKPTTTTPNPAKTRFTPQQEVEAPAAQISTRFHPGSTPKYLSHTILEQRSLNSVGWQISATGSVAP